LSFSAFFAEGNGETSVLFEDFGGFSIHRFPCGLGIGYA